MINAGADVQVKCNISSENCVLPKHVFLWYPSYKVLNVMFENNLSSLILMTLGVKVFSYQTQSTKMNWNGF